MVIKQRILQSFLSTLVIFCLLFVQGCIKPDNDQSTAGHSQPPRQPGIIYSTLSGQPISYTQLLNELATSRFILVGEKHDNPHHHQFELELLQSIQNRNHTRVVFEMLDEQQASNIEKLTSDNGAEEIKRLLNWNDRSWSWKDYGPLINSALANGNQLKAGNLSRPVLMQIYKNAPPEESRFETVKEVPEKIQAQILQQVFDSHCQTMPLKQMTPMAQIQISRDASMAFAMNHQLPPNAQAILFTGAFHARKDSGVPLHLNILSEEKITTIILTEITESEEGKALNPELNAAEREIADYIWFTPRSEEKDYCASLRQQSH